MLRLTHCHEVFKREADLLLGRATLLDKPVRYVFWAPKQFAGFGPRAIKGLKLLHLALSNIGLFVDLDVIVTMRLEVRYLSKTSLVRVYLVHVLLFWVVLRMRNLLLPKLWCTALRLNLLANPHVVVDLIVKVCWILKPLGLHSGASLFWLGHDLLKVARGLCFVLRLHLLNDWFLRAKGESLHVLT